MSQPEIDPSSHAVDPPKSPCNTRRRADTANCESHWFSDVGKPKVDQAARGGGVSGSIARTGGDASCAPTESPNTGRRSGRLNTMLAVMPMGAKTTLAYTPRQVSGLNTAPPDRGFLSSVAPSPARAACGFPECWWHFGPAASRSPQQHDSRHDFASRHPQPCPRHGKSSSVIVGRAPAGSTSGIPN